MVNLVGDIILTIFSEIYDTSTLHSCALVNKDWCRVAIPLLWNCIPNAIENPFNYSQESREKFYNVIAHFLPNDPEDILPQNDIILPLNKFPNKPIFNYLKFFTHITEIWVRDMVFLSINDDDVKVSECKKKILEREVYNLILNRCDNVEHFSWNTKEKLYKYPNSKNFFSELRSFEFNSKSISSKSLFRLVNICRNITNLTANDCNMDSPALSSFIKVQKNLQSLCLHFAEEVEGKIKRYELLNNQEEKRYELLSYIINKRAASLKKVKIYPTIALILPPFISSLNNIQFLTLDNEYNNSVNWCEWEKYLKNNTSFPYLQYLKTSGLPNNITRLIIEKSGGIISEIIIRSPLKSDDHSIQNKILMKIISKYCEKLIRLTMCVDYRNLSEPCMIFENCTQLNTINFTTNANILPNGDELLRAMSDVPPIALQEFSFGDKWNFSLKGLELFFEKWKSKNRPPIKFIHRYDELIYTWSDDHEEIVKKYKNKGIIR